MSTSKKRARDSAKTEEGDAPKAKRPFTKEHAKAAPSKPRNTKLLINIEKWRDQNETSCRQYKIGRMDPFETTFVQYCTENGLVRSETVFTLGSGELQGTDCAYSAYVGNKYWIYANHATHMDNRFGVLLGHTEDVTHQNVQ